MAIKDLEDRYNHGLLIMEQLFKLTDSEIKAKLQSICGDLIPNESLLKEESGVRREIENMKPVKITIEFYDWITITPFGIHFHPEHGNAKDLIPFNKHFVL